MTDHLPGAWHQLPISDVVAVLDTSLTDGLGGWEVQSRQQQYGPNALTAKQRKKPIQIFLEQFNQPLIYVLLAAALITAFLREWVDMTVILAVIVINALVGFLQEAKAVKVMEALAQAMSCQATVLREGQKHQIPAQKLVPGDIVFLQSGDRVPADLRLFESRNLQIDESALTGESVPAQKDARTSLSSDTPLADRANMAQSSTLVTYGVGTGIVTEIGDRTQIGHIKQMVETAELLTTPLTLQLERFSLLLTKLILGIAVVALIAAYINGFSSKDALLGVVALAVGAVPEGLPVVVTITLAIGVSRMARRNVIVRKLPVVETLGSTTVICSDKTGTLTQNEMTVQEVITAEGHYPVSGIGYDPRGEVEGTVPLEDSALIECLRAGVLCNDSRLVKRDSQWGVEGDPTEVALIVVAHKAGMEDIELSSQWPRCDVIPFESQHQFMATLHRHHNISRVYLKGSVESLLPRCQSALGKAEKAVPLNKTAIEDAVHQLAKQGLRVLAFARVDLSPAVEQIHFHDIQSGLTFLGLQGMMDPPRPAAIAAVHSCQSAGINIKMITGDHITTAIAIGRQVGLGSHDPEEVIALTGPEIDQLSDEDLPKVGERASVFARVAPEQKLRLVKALQSQGHVVAMTGDGVNDAPALRQADIGVAMGCTGTEVAKEAADMVLLDDNFATIEVAVQEGRRIYDNIVKSIIWLLPTNASLGLIIVVTLFFNVGAPVTPLQILWINTIAAVLLGTMLAFEVAEPRVMKRLPRSPQQPLLSGAAVAWIGVMGAILCAIAFGVYHWALQGSDSTHQMAQTMAVNTIVSGQIFLLWACRSLQYSSVKVGLFSNLWLWAGVGSMIVAQMLLTYLPLMNRMFDTTPLNLSQWGIILGAGAAIYIIFEGIKWISRQRSIF